MTAGWSRRERLLLLVLAAGLTALVLAEPLFGERCTLSFRLDDPRLDLRPWAHGDAALEQPSNPITPDIDGFVLPGVMRARQLADGGGPWWDDSQLLGYPFAANMPYPLASPLTWVFQGVFGGIGRLDPVTFLDVMLWAHLVVALLLGYRACRMLGVEPAFSAVGAIGFAFSGWMLTHWHAPHLVYTTSWWPAQLAALEWLRRGQRRRAVLEGGLATGLMFLSGHPQVGVVLTGSVLLLALLDRELRRPRVLAAALVMAALGVALASPQLVLNQGAYETSLRNRPETQAATAARGLPPMSLVGAVLPEFFGHPPDFSMPDSPAPSMESYLPQRLWWSHDIQNSVVENVLYPGCLLLLLVGVALARGTDARARRLLLVAALAVVVALLGSAVTSRLPWTRVLAAGSVKRALVLVGACLPIAGALALQALGDGRSRVPWRSGLLLVAGVALTPLLVLLIDDPEAPAFAARLGGHAFRQASFLLAGLAVLTLVARPGRWLPRKGAAARPGRSGPRVPARLVRWLPALVIAADLVLLARGFNPFPLQTEAFPSTPALAALGEREGRLAVFAPSATLLPPTTAGLHGLRAIHGVAPMVSTRTAELLGCLEGALVDARDPRVVAPLQDAASLSHPLLDLLGVDTVVHAESTLAATTGLPVLFERPSEGLGALARPTAGPGAFVCSGARVVSSAPERLALLAERDFPVHATVLLERPAEVALPERDPGPVRPAAVRRERSLLRDDLILEVDTPRPGVAVLTEATSPGWSVAVDGEPADLHIVDHALMGVVVSAGRHLVVFSYEPPGLVAASVVAGVALLLLAWLALGVLRSRAGRASAASRASSPGSSPGSASGRDGALPALAAPAMPRAAADLGAFEGQGVSIIIPAYEDSARLRRALWSIRQTTDLPYELIVSEARQSVAKNRNAGLDRASNDLIVFMDDDVLLPAGWASRLVAALASDPGIGAVSAQLSFDDGSPQMRRADLAPGELWEVIIPGTCFAYSRGRVADQRFDEVYQGSQWEDTDWMWALRERGLRSVVTGDVWVIHEHADKENKWFAENGGYFLYKWGRAPSEEETCSISVEQHVAWKPPPLPPMPPIPGA